MGLEEGILEHVKKQGIEKGIEQERKTVVFRLFDSGFDVSNLENRT